MSSSGSLNNALYIELPNDDLVALPGACMFYLDQGRTGPVFIIFSVVNFASHLWTIKNEVILL